MQHRALPVGEHKGGLGGAILPSSPSWVHVDPENIGLQEAANPMGLGF